MNNAIHDSTYVSEAVTPKRQSVKKSMHNTQRESVNKITSFTSSKKKNQENEVIKNQSERKSVKKHKRTKARP